MEANETPRARKAGRVITPQELKRVRRARVKRDYATTKREQASADWERAIRDAHAAGIPLRVIAEFADVSHVRVLQIVRGK